MDRIERALKGAYLHRSRGTATRESDGGAAQIMALIRAAARERRAEARGDTRFLWRFVSAGAIAVAALLLVAITNLPQDTVSVGIGQDDVVSLVLNPTMPF
jgi:hypothetical protein